MTMRTLAVAMAFTVSATLAAADVRFAGYLVSEAGTKFMLSVDETKTSHWLSVGQSFEGYIIVSFDRSADVLTVEQAGMQHSLPLVTAKVKPPLSASVAALPIIISIAGQDDILVTDDPAALDALKFNLGVLAAMVPQPVLMARGSPSMKYERVVSLVAAINAAKIKRWSFRSTHDFATKPEPPSP